jgi:hypothetical protein
MVEVKAVFEEVVENQIRVDQTVRDDQEAAGVVDKSVVKCRGLQLGSSNISSFMISLQKVFHGDILQCQRIEIFILVVARAHDRKKLLSKKQKTFRNFKELVRQ